MNTGQRFESLTYLLATSCSIEIYCWKYIELRIPDVFKPKPYIPGGLGKGTRNPCLYPER